MTLCEVGAFQALFPAHFLELCVRATFRVERVRVETEFVVRDLQPVDGTQEPAVGIRVEELELFRFCLLDILDFSVVLGRLKLFR